MPFDDNTVDTTAPHIGSPLAGLGPETIKKIAAQSRPLFPEEESAIKQAFGDSVDPKAMRIAYDAGTTGTNLRGYVLSQHLPTVMFFPTDTGRIPDEMLHEATHVWQNLTGRKYVGKGVTARINKTGYADYAYDKDAAASKPFTQFGLEQQGDMVKNNEASARAFVQAHKANRPLLGDMAFLDSVRSRYGSPAATLEHKIPGIVSDPAKYNAVLAKEPFSVVDRSSGSPQLKQEEGLFTPKMGKGDHNVVLENLRTKFPAYRGVPDGKVLAALLYKHPEYLEHVGHNGLRLALESGHKPNGKPTQ